MQSLKTRNSLKANIRDEISDSIQSCVESIRQRLDTVNINLPKKIQSLDDVMKFSVRSPVHANNVTSPRHNDGKFHDAGNDSVFAHTRKINKKTCIVNNKNSLDNSNPSNSDSSTNDNIKSINRTNNNRSSSSGRRSLSSCEYRGPSTRKGSNTLLIGDFFMRGILKRGLNHIITSSRYRAGHARIF